MQDEKCQIIMPPDQLPRTSIEYGDREVMAYLAWQLPFTLACINRVFGEVKQRIPSFQPRKMFDFGLGPGTAIM